MIPPKRQSIPAEFVLVLVNSCKKLQRQCKINSETSSVSVVSAPRRTACEFKVRAKTLFRQNYPNDNLFSHASPSHPTSYSRYGGAEQLSFPPSYLGKPCICRYIFKYVYIYSDVLGICTLIQVIPSQLTHGTNDGMNCTLLCWILTAPPNTVFRGFLFPAFGTS
ncbi:hypothetical protein BGX38DRAFT_1214685 [Terfezia claveryi]|nr:hypothetical protein BGX38DRAFT_1214685 [Terfezia claveryi]